jgi:hypothetical protein
MRCSREAGLLKMTLVYGYYEKHAKFLSTEKQNLRFKVDPRRSVVYSGPLPFPIAMKMTVP